MQALSLPENGKKFLAAIFYHGDSMALAMLADHQRMGSLSTAMELAAFQYFTAKWLVLHEFLEGDGLTILVPM